MYSKLLRPLIKFYDTQIRNYEFNTSNSIDQTIGPELNQNIIKLYVEYGMKSHISNDIKNINIIPKIFDLLSKNKSSLQSIFETYSRQINTH